MKAEVINISSISILLQRFSFFICIVFAVVIWYPWKTVSSSDTFLWEGTVCFLETRKVWSASLCYIGMHVYVCNIYSFVNFWVGILEIWFFKRGKTRWMSRQEMRQRNCKGQIDLDSSQKKRERSKYIIGLTLIETQSLGKQECRQLSCTLLFSLCPSADLLLYSEITR